MLITYRNLEEAINQNQEQLQEGHTLSFLFEDGVATVYEEARENGEKTCMTFIEEVPQRILGSIAQFRKEE